MLAVGALVSGCAASLALMALDKWFGGKDTPNSYKVYLDGYEMGTTPSASGAVSLRGAEEGDYLLTVARTPDMRRGIHTTLHVPATRIVNLKDLNPFEGGVISGTVRRDGTTGPLVGNVRVVAILNGASLLAGGSGPLTIPQPLGTTVETMMGYTDASGNYKLGPAKYGDWLVVSVLGGYAADVQFVHLSSGVDATAALILAPLDVANTGSVRGTVTSRTGAALAGALLTAKLGSALSPVIPDATRARIATASGLTMPAGDWFQWQTLTALASAAGQYQVDLPVGSQTLQAFKFQWQANDQPVNVTVGGGVTLDFSLVGG